MEHGCNMLIKLLMLLTNDTSYINFDLLVGVLVDLFALWYHSAVLVRCRFDTN